MGDLKDGEARHYQDYRDVMGYAQPAAQGQTYSQSAPLQENGPIPGATDILKESLWVLLGEIQEANSAAARVRTKLFGSVPEPERKGGTGSTVDHGSLNELENLINAARDQVRSVNSELFGLVDKLRA